MSEPALQMPGLHSASTVTIGGGTFNSAGGDINNFHHHYHNTAHENALPAPSNESPIPNFREIQQDALSKATDGTGRHIVDGKVFTSWVKCGKVLWGTGIPGAGKTTVASIAIDYLEKRSKELGGVMCVGYVFIRYSQPLTVRTMLKVLIAQLSEQHRDIANVVESAYARHAEERTIPREKDLQAILAGIAKSGKLCFFILDGLDETSTEDQLALLKLLDDLPDCKILVTSRPLPKLELRFPQATFFRVAAQEKDIRLYIGDRMSRNIFLGDLLADPHFKEEVVTKIIAKADGMYVPSCCATTGGALSMLNLSKRQWTPLEAFPPNLEDAYLVTWKRIEGQAQNQVELAKHIFLWVTYAETELKIDALRRLIATSPYDYTFEQKRMVAETGLLSVCCGLVKLDKWSRRVRLVHSGIVAAKTIEFLENSQSYFLERWGFTSDLHHQFIVAAMYGFASFLKSHSSRLDPNATMTFRGHTPLVLASWAGHPDCVEALLAMPSIKVNWDGEDVHKWHARIPLKLVVRRGDSTSARLLLEHPGIDVNRRVHECDDTALYIAATQVREEMVRLLLQHPNIDVNLGPGAKAPLSGAAARMPNPVAAEARRAILRMLLQHPRIDPNKGCSTPLMYACRFGDMEFISLLLAHPAIDVNARESKGKRRTALIRALDEQKSSIAQMLLKHDRINVHLAQVQGWAALCKACLRSYNEIVGMILEKAGKDATSLPSNRDWGKLVSQCVQWGRKEIAQMLRDFESRMKVRSFVESVDGGAEGDCQWDEDVFEDAVEEFEGLCLEVQ
ncbi:ankyrin repeat-containing domain protein [Coprinopsis sp. MPI-PUGE-AT-0042]|nr:ankyrin repeat-containing domain protein [Coprinopsis sp. MPI-PUGE-AT-0042]